MPGVHPINHRVAGTTPTAVSGPEHPDKAGRPRARPAGTDQPTGVAHELTTERPVCPAARQVLNDGSGRRAQAAKGRRLKEEAGRGA